MLYARIQEYYLKKEKTNEQTKKPQKQMKKKLSVPVALNREEEGMNAV